jgi:hypothetical protein
MFLAGAEGVGFHFHVLCSRTRFRRYCGRRLPFSCFALPNLFSTILTASGPIFMFCASRHIFGSAEGVGSHFHLLCSRTRFRRYCGRRLPFSCFALPNLFSTILTASGPIFIFCAPRHIFGNAEGVGSHFHVLRARNSFQLYRGHRFPFSCFAFPDSFSAESKASAPLFMFCVPGLVFGGTVGAQTHFLRC